MRQVVLAIVLCFGLVSSALADLNTQMQQMYDGLINVSPPGTFNTQRRGVLSGGSIYARNRIYNADLISFAPPRFDAGCGGIDFFAGSFSFISGEEFQALMRAVASNAQGYAFELALGAMCPSCLATIETLQQKIQELNQYFGNSCQLAQGIVNDSLGAMLGRTVGDASLIATAGGAVDDIFSGWTGSGGQNPVEKAEASGSPEVAERVYGNLVWRALQEQGAGAWFTNGDNDLLQVLMNVSGTVIVSPPASGSDSPVDPITVFPNMGLVTAIVEGQNVTIRGCTDGFDEDECLVLGNVDVLLEGRGFRQRIERAFLGGSTSPGLIAKMRNNSLGTPTAEEIQVSSLMTGAIGSMIIRLSRYSEEASREFAREASYYMAVQMTEMLVKSSLEAVEAAVSVSDHGFTPALRDLIGRSRDSLNHEISRLAEEHGSFADLVHLYSLYMNVVPPGNLTPRLVSTEQ